MTKDKSIFIRNIYYMLSYAFTTLHQGGYESVETEEFENLHNLFAAILAKGIGRQLKQGLYVNTSAGKRIWRLFVERSTCRDRSRIVWPGTCGHL